MNSKKRLMLVLGLLVFGIVFDQSTKIFAKHSLAHGPVYSYLADSIRLQYAENSGAFLSLGDSLPGVWRTAVFTYAVALFLLGLAGYLVFRPPSVLAVLVGWTLVCAGGLSNLIDRVLYEGRVIDFLNVGLGPLRTGIFNVADVALTVGILLLLGVEWRAGSQKKS